MRVRYFASRAESFAKGSVFSRRVSNTFGSWRQRPNAPLNTGLVTIGVSGGNGRAFAGQWLIEMQHPLIPGAAAATPGSARRRIPGPQPMSSITDFKPGVAHPGSHVVSAHETAYSLAVLKSEIGGAVMLRGRGLHEELRHTSRRITRAPGICFGQEPESRRGSAWSGKVLVDQQAAGDRRFQEHVRAAE